jgi:predicted transcriptional regulator
MSRNIMTVSPEMTVEELVDLMFKEKHMGYPVVDNEQPTGIVTFNDVQKVPKEERKHVRVSQIMTQELITAKEDDDAIIALKMMTVNNIGRVIVINDGKMTGIVSRTDLLRSVQILE